LEGINITGGIEIVAFVIKYFEMFGESIRKKGAFMKR
jgi:hypothetical protein